MIIDEITHVAITKLEYNEKSQMKMRPWYGIVFSLGGELLFRHNEKELRLSGGSAIFLPRHTTYEFICTKSGSFALINFQAVNELDVKELFVITSARIDSLHREFKILLQSFSQNEEKTSYINLSTLYKILSILTNAVSKEVLPPILSKAVEYIESHIAFPTLTNAHIAKAVGISEVYLRKLFSQHLSTSISHYLRIARIEKAKSLLAETSMSVSEIAEQCGYSNIYYFCRVFKKNMGCTPSVYRNTNFIAWL